MSSSRNIHREDSNHTSRRISNAAYPGSGPDEHPGMAASTRSTSTAEDINQSPGSSSSAHLLNSFVSLAGLPSQFQEEFLSATMPQEPPPAYVPNCIPNIYTCGRIPWRYNPAVTRSSQHERPHAFIPMGNLPLAAADAHEELPSHHGHDGYATTTKNEQLNRSRPLPRWQQLILPHLNIVVGVIFTAFVVLLAITIISATGVLDNLGKTGLPR